MKKILDNDAKVVDGIVEQLLQTVSLQQQADTGGDSSEEFVVEISKKDIKEKTGRKVVRDIVLDGYTQMIESTLVGSKVSRKNDVLEVTVPQYGQVRKPIKLSDIIGKNEALKAEINNDK